MERKIRIENRSIRTTIPKDIAEYLKITETGQMIDYSINKNGDVVIRKVVKEND